jgi:pimeloyl-ACP methyl ester carboxylesterase
MRDARQAVRRGVLSVASPRGIRGIAVEGAWVAAHLALYPLGMLRQGAAAEMHALGIGHLAPVQRGLVVGDVEAAGTPILLVHGMADNRSIFTLLRRGLRRRGFGRVLTLNYSPMTIDVRVAAERLAEQVELLCADTGYERVHMVGHSMGGLVARYYVQRLGGDDRVHTLVTLGAPHSGTASAYLVPYALGRQLTPGSDLIRELGEPAPGCRTRFLVFWSDLDQLIVPKHAARLDHPDLAARNVLVRGVGHMSLPITRTVVHQISTALAHLGHDGSTLTAGVTPLDVEGPGPTPPPGSAPVPGRRTRSVRL